MTNKEIVSHTKIIMLIAFLLAAIMTSVFVFHAKQPPKPAVMTTPYASLFTVPRDLKPFDLVSKNQQPFTQKNLRDHWTLIFFGFTHCSNVCPATLAMISRSYKTLHTLYPNLQIVLVSIDPERDTPDTVAQYAKAYHPAFIGTTGKIQELRKLQSQFGVYSARDSKSGSDYQLQHTSSIMLINPEGKWAGLFKYGMKPAQFTETFKESVKSLSRG